jgi:hypothetical protein
MLRVFLSFFSFFRFCNPFSLSSKDPSYVPDDTPFTDAVIKGLSVRDIFIFLATPLKARAANCRTWLKSKERDWKCS